MLAFLLPLASKIIRDSVAKIPENEALGEKLVEICLVILEKAVKLTKTTMDDQLLETVKSAIAERDWYNIGGLVPPFSLSIIMLEGIGVYTSRILVTF